MIEIFVCLLVIGLCKLLELPSNMSEKARRERMRKQYAEKKRQAAHEAEIERKRKLEELLDDLNDLTAVIAREKEASVTFTDESRIRASNRYIAVLSAERERIIQELEEDYHIELK